MVAIVILQSAVINILLKMSMKKKVVSFKEPVPIVSEEIVDSDSPVNSENEEDFQHGQRIEIRDVEYIPAVNTQAVEEAIATEVKTKASRKRSTPDRSKKLEKKKKLDVEEEMNNSMTIRSDGQVTLLGLVMLLWTPDFLLISMKIFRKMVLMSLREKQFEAKKVLPQLMDSLLSVQKVLVSQKIELDKCSQKLLATELLNLKSSTMFLEPIMSMETSEWIAHCYSENLPEQSSSSPIMETTSTLSTIVPSPTVPVDAFSSTYSEATSMEDTLDELYQAGSSTSGIGSISQSISRRTPGGISTLTSPGERG